MFSNFLKAILPSARSKFNSLIVRRWLIMSKKGLNSLQYELINQKENKIHIAIVAAFGLGDAVLWLMFDSSERIMATIKDQRRSEKLAGVNYV